MAKFYDAITELPRDISLSTYTSLINQLFENFEKSSLALLLEHNPL
jgi:hypothetical protein